MAFSQAQLDALEDAITQGALSVKYADKEVTYRSVSEMLRIRDLIRRQLGLVQQGSNRITPTISKGTLPASCPRCFYQNCRCC